jgi:chromosome segregation ATPase
MADLPDSETTVEAISDEIQRIVNEREENTINLCKLSASFMHKKNEVEADLEEMKKQELKLTLEKKEMEEKLKEVDENIEKKKKEIEINRDSIKIAKIKHAENLKENEVTNERLKAFTRERNIISSELNELREFIKLQVPVRLVKRIVCTSCFSRVLSKYHELFKTSNPSPAEMRKGSIQKPQKKQGACSSCEVF